MNRKLAFTTGLALLAAGAGAGVHALMATPAEGVVVQEIAATPAPSIPPAEITAVQGELARLRTELGSLREQVAATRTGASEPGPAAGAAEPPPTEQEVRAEAELRRREYMAGVESAFLDEGDDRAWAASTSSLLRETLATDEAALAAARGIECRSSTCRVELADDGTGRLSKFLPMFAHRVGQVLPTVAADRVEDGRGGASMILYLSRHD